MPWEKKVSTSLYVAPRSQKMAAQIFFSSNFTKTFVFIPSPCIHFSWVNFYNYNVSRTLRVSTENDLREAAKKSSSLNGRAIKA